MFTFLPYLSRLSVYSVVFFTGGTMLRRDELRIYFPDEVKILEGKNIYLVTNMYVQCHMVWF